MSIKERLGSLTRTKGFMIVFGLICLALAYLFVLIALDSGSLLDYAIAVLFVFVGVRELVGGIIKRKNKISE